MGGLGFSKSKSQETSSSRSFVDPSQAPFLQNLRQQASGLQAQQQQQIGSLFGLSQSLLGQGGSFLGGINQGIGQLQQGFGGQQQQFGQAIGQGFDALGGIAGGTNPALQQLQQQASGQNPFLQQNIDQLGADVTRQFERGLSATNINAVGAGQLGGGRQGVAQGLLGEAATQEFARGATALRSQDIGRQLQASQSVLGAQAGAGGQLGAQGLQGLLGQQGLGQAGLLGAGQLGLGGLGQLGGLFDLGFSPFAAEFSPLQSLAGIIGGPTVLSEGESQKTSSQFGADISVG